MQRTKVFGVAAALVAASLAAILMTGGASAASWHTYKGNVFAGHAYGLDVPAGAESIEFSFDGAQTGSASIGVYAPGGAKAGFYDLAPELNAASIANPDAGRYVVYVYDVTDGALSLRVASEKEPAKLDLQPIDLVREETKIGTFEQGELDQTITADLKKETVFVTLLYEGSARGLDATVSSTEGAVVTITDETATAFEPGVWTSIKGERAFDAANLAGTVYTVEVHADAFEGTMVLTSLKLSLPAPTPVPPVEHTPHTPHKPHREHHAPIARPVPVAAESAQFAIEEATPVAFEVTTATALLLATTAPVEEDDAKHHHGGHGSSLGGVVAIYAPDDTLVGIFDVADDEPTSIDLAAKGEYVAYARDVDGDALLATLEGQSGAPAVRTLPIEEASISFAIDSLFGTGGQTIFDLDVVPVDMSLRVRDGVGALSGVDIWNERGSVASASSVATVPGFDVLQWTSIQPENFATGEHTLSTHGAYSGEIDLVYTFFVRSAESDVHVEAKTDVPDREPEPSEPPTPPTPPEPPTPGAAGGIRQILDGLF